MNLSLDDSNTLVHLTGGLFSQGAGHYTFFIRKKINVLSIFEHSAKKNKVVMDSVIIISIYFSLSVGMADVAVYLTF